ncbi:MAG TPA: murein biosynthesis integral membrane protein MurJ [Planctomycetota bacterium]|nr:murein biosynthesis integral membrane protein MurJ [Planctomycetota bacterium]
MASEDSDGRMLHATRSVSLLTLLSRVLGLARDSTTAWLLGSSWVNDALTYAWTLPNTFRRLFGEGALSSAFVPVFARVVEQEGRERARRVANVVITTTGLFLLALALLLVLLAGALPLATVARWTGQPDPARAAVLVGYVQIVLPYLAGVCVVAQMMAMLNVLGEFTVPALAGVIVNVVWIAGVAVAWLVAPGDAVAQGGIIAWSVLVSAALQLLWQLPRLAALGVGLRLARPALTPEFRAVLANMGPMVVGMGAGQIAVLADSQVALMVLEEGGRSHVYYAMRLVQFPMGLVAVALGTVAYPMLARLVARGDRAQAAAAAGLALRIDLLLTLPAAVGLGVLARPIVGLLFEHGAFTAPAADLTAQALVGYTLGIPAAGAVLLLTRASYALGNMQLPVRVGLTMLGVQIALDIALARWLGEFGLGLASSLCSVLSAAALAWGVRRLLGEGATGLSGRLLPLLGVCAAMGVLVFGVDAWLAARAGPAGGGYALRVVSGTALGLLSFALLASRLCRQEWQELAGLWRGRAG